jgi:2-hydroxychromene-2-carboxylate isomerase
VPGDALRITHHGHGASDEAARTDDAQPEGVQPVFYYDLGSPESYLAAERVMAALPVVPEWTPIEASVLAHRAPADPAARRAAVEREAASRHVQPLRWPSGWPADVRAAMIAATYAKQIGRAVAFSLAAFRQAFAGGRDLTDENTILIAAAACEMHPRAVVQALGRASVAAALAAATAEAAAAGVRDVPALRIGTVVFHGGEGIDEAARALEGTPTPP